MKWTEKQAEAIEIRDKNMLVAAAAGSGKTAVLVERIKQLILKDGVSVDELLVVTFTNAAAAEMREKIIKAVTRELEESSGDTAFLRRQLNNIYKANISTFHAFALEVIRRFFHIINLEPDFKICDEAQQIILKGKAMDRLFEESFESGEEDFTELLNCYASSKNEDIVKDMIYTLYDAAQSRICPWQWLDECVEQLNSGSEEFAESRICGLMYEMLGKRMEKAAADCAEAVDILKTAGAEKLAEKCAPELKNLEKSLKKLKEKDFEGFRTCLSDQTYARMVPVKAEKEALEDVKEEVAFYRDACKEAVKEIQERYCFCSLEEQLGDMKSTYGYARTLASLVKRFDELYKEEKEEKKLIDFSDIEHYALEILGHPQAAAEYREKFRYIFIDEYQDTNTVQEAIIDTVKRENNVFMVGDVKQSIYKFRLAEPKFFMEKYERFKSGTGVDDIKLDLNANFRSKKGVIDSVNSIFKVLMKNYDEAAMLYKGIAYDGELQYPTELHILEEKTEDGSGLSEEVQEMKTAEKEAFIAGQIIKENLGKPVYDVKASEKEKKAVIRPLTLKDIVILVRGQKNYAEKFQSILTDMDIPSHISGNDGYFDTLEIQIFLNLLRVIDNRRQDIPLISVLHSNIFEFDVHELAEIRTNCKNTSYFDAFRRYALGMSGDEGTDEGSSERSMSPELIEKCRTAIEKIDGWKELSKFMPLDEFIWKLLWETGYYTFMGALPGGTQRQANLRALIDKAVQFQSAQMKGLYGFISYVEAIKDRKVPMGQVSLVGENDDVVRIMTIHKSKGLEFPLVIVAGMGRKFNNAASRNIIDTHSEFGMGLRYINRKEHFYRKTMIQNIIQDINRIEDLEEEIRILYVAFTRAQDKLVLLGTVKDFNKLDNRTELQKNIDLENASSYMELILAAVKKQKRDEEIIPVTTVLHNSSEISVEKEQESGRNDSLRELFKTVRPDMVPAELYSQIENQLSFKYGFEHAQMLKSKFSVSEINRFGDLLESIEMTEEQAERMYYESSCDTALAVPEFAKEKSVGISPAERGTIVHSVLEHWNFKECAGNCSRDEIDIKVKALVKNMEKKLLLTGEEAEIAEKYSSYITNLQMSELGQRLSRAEEIFKETPFNLMIESGGEKIIIQGIIDCYFKEDGKYILLDYKTNVVHDPESESEKEHFRKMYEKQIELYCRAIEEAQGVKISEAYLYMLNASLEISML
ncbi:MAG: helicase-exonuclease AddAB subunit AddA [Anaerovoracaceae bacterium]